MTLSRTLLSLLLVFDTCLLMAQTTGEEETYFLLDYWPVILLPIFGIIWYSWWRSKRKKQ